MQGTRDIKHESRNISDAVRELRAALGGECKVWSVSFAMQIQFNGATRTKKRCTNNPHKITTAAGRSTSSGTEVLHRFQLTAHLKWVYLVKPFFSPPSNNGGLTSKVKAACWALPAFPLHFTRRPITSPRVENDSAPLDSVSEAP